MPTQPKPIAEPSRIHWADVPTVFIVLPACVHCGGTDYQTIRSEPNGDGSTTRKAVCRVCSHPFKICAELPNFGKGSL
jgi:hypothetical protein